MVQTSQQSPDTPPAEPTPADEREADAIEYGEHDYEVAKVFVEPSGVSLFVYPKRATSATAARKLARHMVAAFKFMAKQEALYIAAIAEKKSAEQDGAA